MLRNGGETVAVKVQRPFVLETVSLDLFLMREAAELLAAREDWPRLYDHERLASNEVPVAAAVYHEDMYVPRDLSLATAAAIPKVRTWVTSEHEHNGLRAAGEQVLDHLLGLLEEDA